MRIAICGAGIAGAALAYWLIRYGNEVTLIERAPKFRTGGYVVDFWGVGYTVAERMGILQQVHEAGYQVQEVRLVDDRGRTIGGFSTKAVANAANGRFTSLPRGDLAAIIYRTIEERVEPIFDNSISMIEERGNGLLVHFDKGSPREYDLVVGADGLHSIVRKLIFGPQSQFERQLGYHVAAFAIEGYRPRDELVYVLYSIPGRQAARFALRDDRTMFLLAFRSDRMSGPEPRDQEERKMLLHAIFADAGWECPQILEQMDQAADLYFDRVAQIRIDAWSKGRVMLIGDAAACVSLMAGEGAGLAMAEAYVLAGELHRAGDDYREAFRRHEQRLRPLLDAKQKLGRRFARAFVPKTRLGIWIRDHATRLLAIPPVARYLFRRELMDGSDLPTYEI
jgi:2-polyprenyl-6-methoxyphenol hydroxylase-like FAD-dependent oxidoreductase